MEETGKQQRAELRNYRGREPFKSLLKGWRVVYAKQEDGPNACVYINKKSKKAYVCPYGGSNVPKDYVLHELLHIAFAILRTLPEKEAVWHEERLIRFICDKILFGI